jgi:mRNA interferase RelE/StbE
MPLSAKYKIAETDDFQKEIKNDKFRNLYRKITDLVYPQLRSNPFFGPNIKKLKGEFEDYYRYRIGSFRLFYTIDKDRVIVFIVSIGDRKETYRRT